MSKKIVLTALVLGIFALGLQTGCQKGGGGISSFKAGSYYAFALTNGSLFFGKLKNQDDWYLYVVDVNYIQRTPPPPQGQKPPPDQPNFRLVQQTADLYGPEDEMIVNRDHLLYYQQLRDDSPIIKTIERRTETEPPAGAPAPAAAPAPQPAAPPPAGQ